MSLLQLSVLLRSIQFYTHHAHHICARVAFNQDHDFLSEIYTKFEADYDDVIERYIGLNGDAGLDESQILMAAAQKVQSLSLKSAKENKEMFQTCLKLIEDANNAIEAISKESNLTQGTLQLIGDQASKNEILVYKIKQRIK